jgi:uncharacterized membrane protein
VLNCRLLFFAAIWSDSSGRPDDTNTPEHFLHLTNFNSAAMDFAYLHLLINHFPILGFVFGVLVIATGFLLKNDAVKLTSFGLITFSALMAIPAFMTGASAEDAVEGLAGITETITESHEDAAALALWLIIPVGVISALAFWSVLKKDKLARSLSIITFVLSVLSAAVLGWVGKTGGQVRHTEFRNGAALSNVQNDAQSADEDDD